MLRRLISSMKSRFTSPPERDELAHVDTDEVMDEARLRDQKLRNQAARSIGEKIVLRTRIQKTARMVGETRELARRALAEAGHARAGGDEEAVADWSQLARAHAGRMQAGEDDLASLRSLYREAVTRAAEARSAIDENAMRLRALAPGRQELADVVDQTVGVMSTTIEDETPTPETLEEEVECLVAQAAADVPGPDPPGPDEQERPGTAEVADGDDGLEALRAELGL